MIESIERSGPVKVVPVRLARAMIRRARAVYLQTVMLGSIRVCKRRVLRQLPRQGQVRMMMCLDTVCVTEG